MENAETGYSNKCFVFEEIFDAQEEPLKYNSFAKDFESSSRNESNGVDHFKDLDTMAKNLVDHLQNGESIRLNSVSRKSRNKMYIPAAPKPKPKPKSAKKIASSCESRDSFFAWICRKWMAIYSVLVASFVFWAIGLIYAQGFDTDQFAGMNFYLHYYTRGRAMETRFVCKKLVKRSMLLDT